MARLGDICEIAAGQGAPQGENSYCNCNEGIPFIKAGDLSDLLSGKLETEIQCVNEIVAKQHKLKLYPAGSILFAKSGMSCMKGYVYRTKNPCYIVSHLAIVIPQGIDGEYLKYYFQHNKPNALIKDSAYPSISLQDISNIELTVPSLDIQASIASELNKVNMLISLRKQQLSKLDELVKSRFIEMFGDPVLNPYGWKTKPLLEMGNCKNGMNFHDGDEGIEINCLGVGDFKDLAMIDKTYELPTISLNEAPPKEYLLKDGDIVFVRSNGNKALVGRCLVVYPHDTPTTYSGFCIRYRLTTNELETQYLLRVLKTESVRKKMAGRGANIQNLNQQILASLIIPIPPKDLQQQFATFVEQTDKSKLAIQQSLEKLETLKKALMQKYFG